MPTKMKKIVSILLVPIVMLFLGVDVFAKPIEIKVAEINEIRSTEEVLRRLNVTFEISGEMLKDAKAILPIAIKNSSCGQSPAISQLEGVTDYNLFAASQVEDGATARQTVYLSSPARTCRKLFLDGEVTVYKPPPSSRIEIDDYQGQSNKILKNQVLIANGVRMMFLTGKQYGELMAAADGHEAPVANHDAHEALLHRFGDLRTAVIEYANPLFLKNADISFVIAGDWEKVVKIELTDASGSPLEDPGVMLSGGSDGVIFYVLDFDEPLPTSGKVLIDFIQDGDTSTVPFYIEMDLP